MARVQEERRVDRTAQTDNRRRSVRSYFRRSRTSSSSCRDTSRHRQYYHFRRRKSRPW